MEEIGAFLKKREEEGCLRSLKEVSSRRNGRICIGAREYIDFSSNDYLGLSGHPALISKAKEALDRLGAGSSASRLLSGDLEVHHRLEEAVAGFKKTEAGLIFNSGYQANVGILSALYCKDDAIFSDRLNHASIVDGILLSRARMFRFHHNDPDHLEFILKKERARFKKALVITETVFSMDGDRSPLARLVDLKERYGCQIMVDEAHATGVYGPEGSGVVEEDGMSGRIDLIMGTFSKALGGFGAYLAASKDIIDYLVNRCRSFIYSTALPPSVTAANLAGLEIVREEPERRLRLLAAARYFRDALRHKGFEIRGSSQIVPLIVGDNHRTLEFSDALQKIGYWVPAIRPPTVPRGEARLRFSLTIYHDMEILKSLTEEIANVGFQAA